VSLSFVETRHAERVTGTGAAEARPGYRRTPDMRGAAALAALDTRRAGRAPSR
jgi:hypothetical protein